MRGTLLIAMTGILLATTSPGCGSKQTPPVMYATPEDCFVAAKAALQAKDFEKYFHCLTPESQVLVCSRMIQSPLMMEGKLDAAIAKEGDFEAFDKVRKMIKAMHEAMDRQGIDRTKLPSPAEVLTGKFGKDPRFTAAATAVPDKPKLLAEIIASGETDGRLGAKIGEWLNGSIEELTIEGDIASAAFKRESGLKRVRYLTFHKQNGCWLIHMQND